ncbi:MAG: alpha-L-rhamnosidase C-terminal domain-containing protein [Rudaea sp.]|uniref:alpha-L-rhamnosidase-related protein n=1 Tax=Rudaea sp. TaxID=2136325 RepID=UPI0039E466FE
MLADAGNVDLVANLLMRQAYPSWGYMVSKGATTVWERWNGDVGDVSMNSFNHYALGAVTGFLYRRLAGIDADEPGFKRIRIAPLVIPGLSGCRASFRSPYGDVSVSWTHSAEGHVPIDVVIPANTTAKVHLPTRKDDRIRYFGRTLATNRNVRLLQRTERETIVECDAGEHRFVGFS